MDLNKKEFEVIIEVLDLAAEMSVDCDNEIYSVDNAELIRIRNKFSRYYRKMECEEQ